MERQRSMDELGLTPSTASIYTLRFGKSGKKTFRLKLTFRYNDGNALAFSVQLLLLISFDNAVK